MLLSFRFYPGFSSFYFLFPFFTISMPSIFRLYSVTLCNSNFSSLSKGKGLFLLVEFEGCPGKSIVLNSDFASYFPFSLSTLWDSILESSFCIIDRREEDLILIMLLVEQIDDFLAKTWPLLYFRSFSFYLYFLCEFFILFSSSS